jgi:hypothetical protein
VQYKIGRHLFCLDKRYMWTCGGVLSVLFLDLHQTGVRYKSSSVYTCFSKLPADSPAHSFHKLAQDSCYVLKQQLERERYKTHILSKPRPSHARELKHRISTNSFQTWLWTGYFQTKELMEHGFLSLRSTGLFSISMQETWQHQKSCTKSIPGSTRTCGKSFPCMFPPVWQQ